MMKIGGADTTSFQGTGGGMQTGMCNDPVSKNIKNQIANAQKQMQEISANQEMTLEEKMKKRQEIQQEITNLNQQLRQRQIEQRKERQSQGSSMEDMLGGKQTTGDAKSGNKGNGLSQASMQAMISADSSMKQAQVQGNVANRMEGRAGVLKAEIKQDAGGNTEAKEAELAEAEHRAMSATVSQMSTLAEANRSAEEAANRSTEEASTTDQTGRTDETGSETIVQTRETSAAVELPAENAAAQTNVYTHVDVRL